MMRRIVVIAKGMVLTCQWTEGIPVIVEDSEGHHSDVEIRSGSRRVWQ